jgi:hypothetical protein
MEGRVAVLGVVVAGVISTVVEPGVYTWGSTVIGLTLVLVLVAYDDHRDGTAWQSAAYAAAWAFSVELVPGFLLNHLLFDPPFLRSPGEEVPKTQLNKVDTVYLILWVLLALGAFLYRRLCSLPRTAEQWRLRQITPRYKRIYRSVMPRVRGSGESWWRKLCGE